MTISFFLITLRIVQYKKDFSYFTNIVVKAEWFHTIRVNIALCSIRTSARHVAASVGLIAAVAIVAVSTKERSLLKR